MLKKKWFVLNLKVPQDPSMREDLLFKVFGEIVSKFKDRMDSWHFLWEPSPYPHTLLLRFYGTSEVIDTLEERFENFLGEKGIEYTPVETYDGEAGSYGVKGWEYVMRILHLGSDFALDLMQEKHSGADNEDFSKPPEIYIDRWMHLFLNQLDTRVVEYDVLFQSSVHRYVISKIGAENYRKVGKELRKETPKFFDALREKVDDFLRKKGYGV